MKRISLFVALLLILTLFSYNNCGQPSHGNKTSTQAPNPGDFGDGGDSGGSSGIRALLTNLVTDLCETTISNNDELIYETCYQGAILDKQIAVTFYDDQTFENLESLVQKIANETLFLDTALMVACENHVANFQNSPESIKYIKEEVSRLSGLGYLTDVPPEIAAAIIILRASPACLNFVSDPGE